MKKIQYKLVCQNKTTGDVREISINPEDFDDEFGAVVCKHGDLASIDLFTTQFVNEESLKKYLTDKGKMFSNDDDIFIAYQDKDSTIHYYDVIYNRLGDNFIHSLRNIGLRLLATGEVLNEEGSFIVSKFKSIFDISKDFKDFVLSGENGLYDQFLKVLVRDSQDNFFRTLSNNNISWVTQSYPLLRNLVGVRDRYQRLSLMYPNVIDASKKTRDYQKRLRDVAFDDLLMITDPTTGCGQISLFSMFEKDVPEEPKLGKRKPKATALYDPSIGYKDKVRYVLETISSLPNGVFYHIKDQGYHFNEKVFSEDMEISEEDKRALDGFMSGSLKRYISEYTRYLAIRRENDSNGIYSYALNEEMANLWPTICRNVRKADNLEGAFQWSMLYNRYRECDQKGDSYGKVRKLQ